MKWRYGIIMIMIIDESLDELFAIGIDSMVVVLSDESYFPTCE